MDVGTLAGRRSGSNAPVSSSSDAAHALHRHRGHSRRRDLPPDLHSQGHNNHSASDSHSSLPLPRLSRHRTYHELSTSPLAVQLNTNPSQAGIRTTPLAVSGSNISSEFLSAALHGTGTSTRAPPHQQHPPPAHLPPGRPLTEASSAAASIIVTLDVCIWRECNFMELKHPAPDTDLSGVYALAALRPAAAANLYDIAHLWMVNNHSCCVHSSRVQSAATRASATFAPGSGGAVLSSREGPKWEIHGSTDIIALVRCQRDVAGNELPQHFLLRAIEVPIVAEVVFRKVDVMVAMVGILLDWLYTLFVLPLEALAAQLGWRHDPALQSDRA